MVQYGYFLSSEELSPGAMIESARHAETIGIESLFISDHFHPWLESQGQSPFVWSVLGAIASSTRQRLMTGVTCPTVRLHPAVLAQATATTQLIAEGRFRFGVGTGENLNEHILGHRWPPVETRLEMLEEAVEVIRTCGRAAMSRTMDSSTRWRTLGSSPSQTNPARSWCQDLVPRPPTWRHASETDT